MFGLPNNSIFEVPGFHESKVRQKIKNHISTLPDAKSK